MSTGGWFRRRSADDPRYIERHRPVELPLIVETQRRIFRGDIPGAMRYVYPLVLEDVQKAYGVQFPPEWTHEEILRRGVPAGSGPVAEFLPRLYRLYAPARYAGTTALSPEDGAEAIELLRGIYSVAPMWRLYAWHRPTTLERLFPPRTPSPPAEVEGAEAAAAEAK